MKYVAPLPCARAKCGWRRAGGKGLKISQKEDFPDDGITKFSDFLLVQLTWVNTGPLLICGARGYVGTIYLSATCI